MIIITVKRVKTIVTIYYDANQDNNDYRIRGKERNWEKERKRREERERLREREIEKRRERDWEETEKRLRRRERETEKRGEIIIIKEIKTTGMVVIYWW